MTKKAIPTQDDGRVARSSSSGDLDLQQIRIAVNGIRYGEVRVIIQDRMIVQIERVEKQRLR
jgi:hypothetical protein